MQESLDEFHANKHVFIELGNRGHFNIPKLHSMLHYIGGIKQLGSADGLNSEASECLHIDFAKQAYNRSNGQDFIAQIVRTLVLPQSSLQPPQLCCVLLCPVV